MKLNNYQTVSGYLLEKYINKISGSGDKKYYLGVAPSEQVMLGMIKAGHDSDDISPKSSSDMRFKSIPSVTLNFSIDKNFTGKIYLKIHGKMYYRTYPTYREQIEYFVKKFTYRYSTISDSVSFFEHVKSNTELAKTRESFVDKFVKLDLNEVIEDIELGYNGKLCSEQHNFPL